MATRKRKKPAQTKQSAYDLYGKAFLALHERDYEKASDLFDEIVSNFPDESEILARIESFRRVCDRAVKKSEVEDAAPASVDALFDLGVFCHNNGDHEEASIHFSEALKLAGENSDHIYYALAASKVQQGNVEGALEDLRKAIAMNEANGAYACNDPDFQSLGEHEDFRRLLGTKS